MKKIILLLGTFALLFCFASKTTYAQTLTDEEYSYVTMDLRGILDLTMTTDPNVDFLFDNIMSYELGIIKHNAVKLEVDATLAWDLIVYANTESWNQVESYATNGDPGLPSGILQFKSSVANDTLTAGHGLGVGNSFVSLHYGDGTPTATGTQYLGGGLNVGAASYSFSPGTAMQNPTTNQFRIDYKIRPGIPALFWENWSQGVDPLGAETVSDYAMPGYYYLEVVYSLMEDL